MRKGNNPNRLTETSYVVQVGGLDSGKFSKLSEAVRHVNGLDVVSGTSVEIVKKTTVTTTKVMRTFEAQSKTTLVNSGEVVFDELVTEVEEETEDATQTA